MFSLAHQHGNILREGWKNILDALVALFKAKLLGDELVQVRYPEEKEEREREGVNICA